ncbi:MAG: chemotaxis protein CheA [Deltaproteobacteria bacterium]|nr:chemotaxis protein CheA [Deltaproteobacteria bacterium]MBN2672819.1 chemotaxis protein CheA [Deltaproteobacteria bacterium]
MTSTKSPNPKAVKEFLSEAQEFVEALSNVLMDIDSNLRDDDEVDPDLINEAFRCWHTLKGLSSTFGAESLAQFAHREETLLDEIRLGRTPLDASTLDALLSSIDVIVAALNQISETGDISDVDVASLVSRPPMEPQAAPTDVAVEIDPRKLVSHDIMEVLTEFEEHRLVTNIERGRPLYKVRASFSLMSIDTELEAIKTTLKPLGEIITYLPCDESDDIEKLDIEVLLALKKDYSELEQAVVEYNARIELVVDSEENRPVATPAKSIPTGRAEESVAAGITPEASGVSVEMLSPVVSNDSIIADVTRDKSLSLRSVSQTVRVDISKLDRLMNSVGELGLVRSSIGRVSDELRTVGGRRDLAIELHRIIRGFERRLAEIREGILEVRMVPVGQMFDRLARVIRKVSRNLGKEIQFIVSGADTEVDKLIIEELSDPLMHIIRNAIDHGVEMPKDRTMMGKPESGTVALTAYQKGNHVMIEVEDDGAGIDGDRIVAAAIRNGAITEEQAAVLSQRDMINLIFLPGISTAKEATEISGRGVGMDVVKTNISALGGLVEVQSELGIGTKFTITMPVTLAITPALLVEVDRAVYAVPLNTVAEAIMLKEKDMFQVMNTETMTLRGQTLPLCRLDTFFNIFREGPPRPNSRVVVASLGQRRVGLVVDALVGQQDVIIKPLGHSMAQAGCFTGVTDIGDQKLALVLDTVAVIEEFFATPDDSNQYTG